MSLKTHLKVIHALAILIGYGVLVGGAFVLFVMGVESIPQHLKPWLFWGLMVALLYVCTYGMLADGETVSGDVPPLPNNEE